MPVPAPAASLVKAISDARHVAVLTGAGVSAESGVPTFRDAQTGLWAKYDPQQLATPEAFASDPQTAWDWYRWRRQLVAKVAPNAGHEALGELSGLVPRLTLITQNVDGLHQRAGSDDVIEFHGNLFRDKCASDELVFPAHEAGAQTAPPLCPQCGAILTPGVVLFGEPIPGRLLQRASAAANDCDLFLCIGTSSLVYPAAGLAETAVHNGATVVEINIDDTPLTPLADHVLRGASAHVLPALVSAVAEALEIRTNTVSDGRSR